MAVEFSENKITNTRNSSSKATKMNFKMSKRNNAYFLLICIMAIGTILTVVIGDIALVAAQQPQQLQQQLDVYSPTGQSSSGISSYLNSARQLLSQGLEAHNSAKTYSGLMPNENPRTAQMLRDTVEQTTDLINSYQREGLSNIPALPNLPGLNTIMRLPDKLLRAELSMLQDGIRMAQELRERPITATVNTPRELANMFLRMTAQLNQ